MLTMENQTSGPKGGFLCDEMGLGKSAQLIATMLGNRKKSTLIVVPKSIITQWANEIGKFAPHLSVHLFDGPKRHLKEADIVIMPYSLLSTPEETIIHRHTWDRVILDEAHEIRNKSSRLFKSVCRLKTDIKWIVTGTPVFNSMNDFVSLCAFLGIEKSLVQGMTNKIQDIYILRRTKEDLAKINTRLELPRVTLKMLNLICSQMRDSSMSLFSRMLKIQSRMRSSTPSVSTAKIWSFLECSLRADNV